MKKNSTLPVLLAVSVLTSVVTSVAGATVSALFTNDGQAMTCASRADIGRPGYRVEGAQGIVRDGKVEIEVRLETMKCIERAGVFSFERTSLEGRQANSKNGFIEFANLELVGYTPDLRFMKAEKLNISQGLQVATFTVPAAQVAGLLPRNKAVFNDSRAAFNIVLRGQASLGDATTGRVMEQSVVPFGATSLLFSTQAGTLRPAVR